MDAHLHAPSPTSLAQAEGVAHTPDGLEAVVFTADGDMRQALNNLQVRQWQGAGMTACLSAAGCGGRCLVHQVEHAGTPADHALSPCPP